MIFDFVDFSPTIQALRGSNPPSANFFRLLCSVNLKQKVRGIFTLKTQKTGPGAVSLTIPEPVFSGFTVFWAIFTLKTRKLPDLSGRQIRQLIWWGKVDSNHRRHCQQIYSLSPLATREFPHIKLRCQTRWSWWTDSNPRPADYKSAALPAELHQHGINDDA